jgi:hypothetical protein
LSQVHQPSSSVPSKQEVHQVSKKCIVSSVGALETSAPPARSAPIVLLVHLRQVHPLERQVHPPFCSVGAVLALASGKAERRQVHPLDVHPPPCKC